MKNKFVQRQKLYLYNKILKEKKENERRKDKGTQ